MKKNYLILFFSFIFLLSSVSAYARCAICYTQGMSGASIAVIVIITSFIILFLANKFLQKIINKN